LLDNVYDEATQVLGFICRSRLVIHEIQLITLQWIYVYNLFVSVKVCVLIFNKIDVLIGLGTVYLLV